MIFLVSRFTLSCFRYLLDITHSLLELCQSMPRDKSDSIMTSGLMSREAFTVLFVCFFFLLDSKSAPLSVCLEGKCELCPPETAITGSAYTNVNQGFICCSR